MGFAVVLEFGGVQEQDLHGEVLTNGGRERSPDSSDCRPNYRVTVKKSR